MKKIFLTLKVLILLVFSATAQKNNEEKMQWFADAKLGIFIHWGIYSVNGISESWSFFNNYVNYDDYKNQLKRFTAKNYDPKLWATLIKESGAKYAVITSKHHDGVALWNSKQQGALTIPKHSAAKKNVLAPFVTELKKTGLKTGIYFSLPDWSYDNYDVFTRDLKRYDISVEPKRFENFVNYYQGQLKEISQEYKPDLLWFDGDWEHSAKEWKAKETKDLLLQYNPNIIINSRLKGYGDYDTPEQGVPVEKPASKYWELCYTMNDSWGYQPFDDNYKSSYMLIRTLVDCISMGGNLLLDIAPKADGTIPSEQIQILKDLGRWTKKHAEAIYETQAGISEKYFAGKSSLSKDRKTLFLYLDRNYNGIVPLRYITNKIKNISVVGTNQKADYQINNNICWIDISSCTLDKDFTVLKITFDEPLELNKNIESTKSFVFEDYFKEKTLQPKKIISQICYDVSKGANFFTNNALQINRQNENKLVENAPQEIKNWIIKHTEALSNTGKGLSDGHYAGLSVLSKDKQTIYLFVEGTPNGPIALKGIENTIARIRIVGTGDILNYNMYDKLYWSSTPGIIYINIPKERLDKYVTVIAVLLDGAVKEHRREVKAIESNL
jgi:alpha-L-fucosidase